jgi:uncharacterized protein YggE
MYRNVIGVLFGAIGLAVSMGAAADDEARGIHVIGYAEVMVTPDIAHITFDLVRQGADAGALTKEVDKATLAIVKLAEATKVKREDITTPAIQVTPEYRMNAGRSILEGVSVRRTIEIKLRNLDRYQALIDGALAAGVNSISNVELDLDNRDELERKALKAAIDDAIKEAGFTAGELGIRVGRVIDVAVQDTQPIVHPLMMAKAEADTSFRPGQIAVARTVNVLFEIASQ